MVPTSVEGSVDSVIHAALSTPTLKNRTHIHFKNLTHPAKKGILNLLKQAAWQGLIVASDTTKPYATSRLTIPEYQYNYALRYVVERVTRYAAAIGEPIDEIAIEDRRNFDIDAFRAYLNKLRARSDGHFEWPMLDVARVVVKKKAQEPRLCLADGLAHAAFKALEPDRAWGHYEMSYLELVLDKLWQGPKGREVHNNGLVLMPTAQWGSFVGEYPWLLRLQSQPLT